MKKIFLDTDLGGDCDDVGAVALLNIFANHNDIEIVGMTHTTSSIYGPKCIDIVNSFYGRTVDIGVTKRKHFLDGQSYNKFAEKMVNHFQSSIDANEHLIEAYQLMRQKLSRLKEGEKLTMVGIGQLNNFYELLTSQKDQYSPLSGYDLIKEKVEEVVLMAGLFNENGEKIFFEGNPYITEYNIVTDIKSAKYFIENCPVKITFIDFLAGYKVKSFGNLVAENDMNHPVTFAYHHFSKGPRESWDPLAVYYACLGEKDIFKLSDKGFVSVDDTGHTHFHIKEDGLHQYVKLNRKEDEIVDILNSLIMLDKGGYK